MVIVIPAILLRFSHDYVWCVVSQPESRVMEKVNKVTMERNSPAGRRGRTKEGLSRVTSEDYIRYTVTR